MLLKTFAFMLWWCLYIVVAEVPQKHTALHFLLTFSNFGLQFRSIEQFEGYSAKDVNVSIGQDMSAMCALRRNESMSTCCLNVPGSKRDQTTTDVDSNRNCACSAQGDEECSNVQIHVAFPANTKSSVPEVHNISTVMIYSAAVVSASCLLLLIVAACLLVLKKRTHACFNRVHSGPQVYYSRPYYANISNQIQASISRERSENTAYHNADTELCLHCGMNPRKLSSEYSLCPSKSAKWSVTNSSMKESSFWDDEDYERSDDDSYDDSGKDSGSLYIIPSSKASSSEGASRPTPRVPNKKQLMKTSPVLPPVVDVFTESRKTRKTVNKECWEPSQQCNIIKKHALSVSWKDGGQRGDFNEGNENRNKQPQREMTDKIIYNKYNPFRNPMILSRKFTSQHALAVHTNIKDDIRPLQNKGREMTIMYKSGGYTTGPAELLSIASSCSINRCSTLAHADHDITRASAYSNSFDDAHGFDNIFNGHDVSCFMSRASSASSVYERFHAARGGRGLAKK